MAGRSALVVGAGVIGVNCAIALRRRGFEVSIVDARGPGEATSFGNAGCIAVAEITPISMPGLVWQTPRMLLDPLGPLSIRWSYLPNLAPWLWRFWRAGNRRRVEEITRALAALVGRAWTDYAPLLADAGLSHMVEHKGALFVYETATRFAKSEEEFELRRRHGVRLTPLDRRQIAAMEPALSSTFQYGYLNEDWRHVVDPHKLVVGLAEYFARLGGRLVRERVAGFVVEGGRVKAARLSGGGDIACDELVVCAGAWSKPLCRALGVNVPLDTERGYNTTLPDPRVSPSRPICPAEGNFLITPMEMGLRIGGAVELAGLEAPPNYRRAKALLTLGQRALPGLNITGGREWMGFRPSMPDSMPVIGRSPRQSNVYFAFGHGHLGLTEGAATGRLIGELAADEKPSIDLTPFRADRF